jgi:ATP-dependent RNA helicase DDX31/DBP7
MGISKPTSIQRASLSAILPTVASDEDVAHSRDIFIQSQTGSGKTLSYLLPIIQDLLPLSSLSYIDRSIGTLAVIIAPTRELAKQISDVLDSLLSLRLSPSTKDDGEEKDSYDGPRLTRWLISGVLVGGSTRTHEKARLRKGVPILVCTPGRLLDHLQNTSSFNIGKCRWLVLDEADRLMDLGFEESITGILKALDGRRNLAQTAVEEGKGMEVGGWDWERRRRTILCSATIREDVQKLAGTTLQKPIVVKASDVAAAAEDVVLGVAGATNPTPGPDGKFTPPSQLSQKYVVAPLKLRLVTLVALLRSILSKAQAKGDAQGAVGTGIIVFLSCTDSVDFHWALFGGSKMGADDVSSDTSDDVPDESKGADEEDDADSGTATEKGRKKRRQITSHVQIEARSSLLPDTSIFRLHGSLPLSTRQTSLRGFSSVSSTKGKERADPSAPTSAILLCTSVASRGLDLPLIRAVLQYDLPTEGGVTEYIHRIGRTARVGKGGEAWAFVGPSEVEWVPWVETKMKGEAGKELKLEPIGVEEILRKGFGGKGSEYEARATDVQLSFERWVLAQKKVGPSKSGLNDFPQVDRNYVECRSRSYRVPVAHASIRYTSI